MCLCVDSVCWIIFVSNVCSGSYNEFEEGNVFEFSLGYIGSG